jgi:hypothetical protein
MKSYLQTPGKKTIKTKLARARRRIAGHKLVRPNHALELIVGKIIDTRPAITQVVMNYAEDRKLFDASGRFVVADENLKVIFLGQPQIHRNDVHRYITLSVLPGEDISDPDGVPIKPKMKTQVLTEAR